LTRSLRSLRFATALLLAAAAAVHADRGTWTGAGPGTGAAAQSGVPSGQMPGPLQKVGYDQKLGGQVPLGLGFRDQDGRAVRLSNYFGQKPVLLVLAYYHCPMLCDMVLTGVTGSLKTMTLDPGKDFDVVVVSIDPNESAVQAAASRANTISRYGRSGTDEGWHFLTGPQPSIDALAASVGFRYVYDAERNEFSHAAGIVILTPEGRISRYLYGIEYAPRDVKLALIESADHKIGTLVDAALLYCFHYDPAIGRYSAMTMRIVRIGAVLTVLGLALMITLLRRSSPDKHPHEPGTLGAARP
jgi:protein SCO1/2